MTTNSGKNFEDVSHVHTVSLMYNLITSSKDSDDLSIGFERSRNRKRDELAQNKKQKCESYISSQKYAAGRLWFCRMSGRSYLWPRL